MKAISSIPQKTILVTAALSMISIGRLASETEVFEFIGQGGLQHVGQWAAKGKSCTEPNI